MNFKRKHNWRLNNVAIGNDAYQTANTTASNNTAVGHISMLVSTTGTENVL